MPKENIDREVFLSSNGFEHRFHTVEVGMSVSSIGSSSLLKLYATLQSKAAKSTDSTDAAASSSAASLLSSVSSSIDATLDSLLSGTDSDSDSDSNSKTRDPLLDALTSSTTASSQSMLASLKSSNGYAQLMQSMLSGTSSDSGSSIFDSLSSSGTTSSNSIYDGNTALMSALRKSGMSTEQVGSIYQNITGAAATATAGSLTA